MSAIKKNLDKVISDNSKQIGFNLSTYDSSFFGNDRNHGSSLKGSEPIIRTGTKTIMGGFHRNSQSFFGGDEKYYKSTAVNFNAGGRHEKNNS